MRLQNSQNQKLVKPTRQSSYSNQISNKGSAMMIERALLLEFFVLSLLLSPTDSHSRRSFYQRDFSFTLRLCSLKGYCYLLYLRLASLKTKWHDEPRDRAEETIILVSYLPFYYHQDCDSNFSLFFAIISGNHGEAGELLLWQ